MNPKEVIICTCAEVSKQQIMDAVMKLRSTDINLICDETGAGVTCGGCRPVIIDILGTYNKRI